ncbi:MAG: phenylalanine--tRNA ligase subunit beta [Candidatus Marinimicrobia bacterium]|nr:phenylalanine--tRNA ligase subunit beta [Candidatus Neomarinimicrobiota bacterium]
MIVNTKWLEKYIDIPYSPEELEEHLTYIGLESKIQKSPVDKIRGVIIAEVLDVSPHPNADRLSICKVSTGFDMQDVVCGAPNVAKGQKVPLALLGTVLPNGMELKPVKIRGINSEGMICAEDELGISSDHSGIMVLDEKAPLGMELSEYLSGEGTSIDIDLTPNRPDCTSHIGVAREISILTQGELKIPEIKFKESEESTEDYIDVEIENIDGCPRYAARVIKNVKIAPSPQWLINHLKSVGIRSINNIVDASSFVLMETGQPLHTFDYRKIEGKKIVVRNAEEGELVETLDGIKRALSKDILLICDAKHPVAIAGVMGLSNSEITPETKDILIESAYFSSTTIRNGSKYLGLSTEASYRFERGVDPEGIINAVNRITDIIIELAGGKVCKGIVDKYPKKISPAEVKVRFKRINRLIGIDIEKSWVKEIFEKLGCRILKSDDESVQVLSPTWRPDLEREADYIEEVIRIYGMHKIPSAKRLQIKPSNEVNSRYDLIEKLRSILCSYGYFEVFNNSLVSEKQTQFTFKPVKPVKLRNPLSLDMAYLRTSLIPGLINTARRNINRRNCDLQIFELGFIQYFDPDSETHAMEILKFSVLITGAIEDEHWGYQIRKSDVFILKGVIEDLTHRFGIESLKFEKCKNNYFRHLLGTNINGKEFCYLGQINQEYLQSEWSIEVPIYVLDANASVLLDQAKFEIRYKPLPIYPAIERDVSILLPEKIPIEEVNQKIIREGGELLREVKFYDLYYGKNVDNGLKSITFNLVFQVADRTLKDKEVDKRMLAIHEVLKNDLNAKLR